MSERFFIKFPTTTYANQICTDLSFRIKPDLQRQLIDKNSVFKYTIKTGARPDIIAHNYYDDSYMDWLIYLNNGITDPYYDWFLNQDEFESFIVSKYGSAEYAEKKILWYENYMSSEETITVDYYNNVVIDSYKKYYEPVYGNGIENIIYYKRKPLELKINTNRIIQATVTLNSNVVFVPDDLVTLTYSGNTNYGRGEVVFANTTVLTIKNVTGNFVPNAVINSDYSDASANIVSSSVQIDNIPVTETSLWNPVTAYDYEVEKNEQNKQIYLLDSSIASSFNESFRKFMKAAANNG